MTVEPELLSGVAESPAPAASPGAAPSQALGGAPLAPPSVTAPVRIDRWLWAARLFKTRSQASKACAAGHVRVNDQAVKAAKLVRPGDAVDAVTPGGRRLVDVVALADKRGPASVAQTLYHDRTPPPPPREDDGFGTRDRGAGRPEKRDRRLLIRLRGR